MTATRILGVIFISLGGLMLAAVAIEQLIRANVRRKRGHR